MLPPQRHGGPVHNTLKLLTDISRRRSNNDNVEGGGGREGGVAEAQARICSSACHRNNAKCKNHGRGD